MYIYAYIYINTYRYTPLTNNSFQMTAAKGPEAHCLAVPSLKRHQNSYRSG